MTRRNPRAKWVLPRVVHPKTTKCFKIEVPDEPYYIAAFRGALLSLASGVQWQDDPTHKAREVALVWRQIYFNVTNCQGQLQFAEEWEDELSICESLRWNNGVLEGFCCGEWVPISGGSGGVISGPSVQPNGTSRPGAGQSKCYNVVLSANQQWQFPFAVQPGDIVTISEIGGTWNDGTATWYKADGTTALFGVSTGGGQHHDGGDPDSTEFHMQLIAYTPSQQFPGTGGVFTIGGTGNQQLTLQANDGTLNDNVGSISFKICVENGASPIGTPWCSYMDFTLSDYGFAAVGLDGTGWAATYIPGTGWDGQAMAIALQVPADTVVTKVTLWRNRTPSNTRTAFTTTGDWTGSHTEIGDTAFGSTSPATVTETSPLAVTAGLYLLVYGNDGSPGYEFTALQIEGTGTNPFGVSNC